MILPGVSSLAHALAPFAHMYVCLLLCVYSALGRRHTAAPSRSWDPWIIQTSRPQCGYILTSLSERTNIIGDLTQHRVSWGSLLMVPLKVHMFSIDYQNYQIQKIKVINKTGHPAYWTKHIETLNCQPALSHNSLQPTIGRDNVG